jgi:hypothetical protein
MIYRRHVRPFTTPYYGHNHSFLSYSRSGPSHIRLTLDLVHASDLSPALIGRERGLALAGPASRQNSATAEAACKQGAMSSTHFV